MKKISLAIRALLPLIILLSLFIIPVSAETISGDILDRASTFLETPGATGASYGSSDCQMKIMYNRTAKQLPAQINVFYAVISQTEAQYLAAQNKYTHHALIKDAGIKYGDVNIEFVKLSHNPAESRSYYTITFDFEWDYNAVYNSPYTTKSFYITGDIIPYNIRFGNGEGITKPATYLYVDPSAPDKVGYLPLVEDPRGFISYQIDGAEFKQHYDVYADKYGMSIEINRIIDGVPNPSKLIVSNATSVVYDSGFTSSNATYNIPVINGTVDIISQATGKTYTIFNNLPDDPVDPDDPDTPITIYIRNSQTYALLANAHIDISASVNGNLHDVANETVPSGIYSIDLQPTGGGMPNPDFYRLIVTAEGYNSIMPHIDFEVDGATSIYAYLDPVAGAPEDENKTFIDFYVRDLAANAISGATVNFGGYTLITNSAGYTMFEVYKNQTYSWTVSKSGYGSVTGNAVIGSNARHTINSVIAPAVTPTTPTAIPTSTPISPTPTMTAPTGEPVSNWLEWFAAHFGMLLGGGAEIGKIFMWLCFSVPVGVYVAKEAKAGAAGFMAGAGVVTLFFVLIGWVPIWLLVLLALIIGLLYAKVFNNSDNGGGR